MYYRYVVKVMKHEMFVYHTRCTLQSQLTNVDVCIFIITYVFLNTNSDMKYKEYTLGIYWKFIIKETWTLENNHFKYHTQYNVAIQPYFSFYHKNRCD